MDTKKPTELRRIQHIWVRDEDPSERPATSRDRWIGLAILLGAVALGAVQALHLIH